MNKTIALVDDSAPFCLLVKQILGEHYGIDTFGSADDFMAIMSRASKYDLILLDINMPGMDGLSALRGLREHPATKDIPILLLTGDSRKDTVVRAKKLGAKDFIVKPIDPFVLEQRVIQLLGGYTV